MNEIYVIDMFVVGDEIYKMKYFGNDLRADKSKSYVIIEIVSRKNNPRTGVPRKICLRMYVRRIFKGINRKNKKMDISFEKLLSGVQKIKMDLLELTHEIKTVEKEVKKSMKAQEKMQKPKAKTGNRKPSGFAEPVRVSKELQTFMKLNEEDKVARTEVTKYLSSYIKEHKLKSPENGRIIVPNPELSALLGAKEEDTITYFNLQRFMNKHFVSSSNTL